jgi:hypothetical protein
MEMIQNEIPTKSSDFKTLLVAAEAWLDIREVPAVIAASWVAMDLIFDVIMLISLKLHDWLK